MSSSPEDPKTVLVIDDEIDLCELVADYLKDEGYHVLLAHNAQAALKIIQTENIDLIISDIRMPGESGEQFIERVKKKTGQDVPLIFATGQAGFTPKIAFEKGALALFEKPFDYDALVKCTQDAFIQKEFEVRRKHERVKIEMPSKVLKNALGEDVSSQTVNLSLGGMFIEGLSLKPNERFEFEIGGFGVPKVTGTAICVWRQSKKGENPAGVGVRFEKLSEKAEENLCRLVNLVKTNALKKK